MKKNLLLLSFLYSFFYGHSQTSLSYRITPWMDNKSAAVSITFDDNCDGQFTHALPVMKSRNIRGTYFIVTGNQGCNGSAKWDYVKNASDDGHEIAAHTVNHYDLAVLDTNSIKYELQASRDTLNARLPGKKALTFAYPYGSGAGNSTVEEKARDIVARYFISARGAGVNPDLNYVSYNDHLNSWFTDFNFQIGSMEMNGGVSLSTFSAIVDSAAKYNGWFIPHYHGIETGGWGNISATAFSQQMDALVSRKATVWTAPYVETFKYHYERRSAVLSAVSEDAAKWVLRLTDALPDVTYQQPLTLRIAKPSWTIASVKQGNSVLPMLINGDTLQINAVPDGGDITIWKSVCGTTVATPSICLVTDNSAGNNIVVWEKTSFPAGTDSFYVYRESSQTGIYTVIGRVSYNDDGIFTDATSNSNQQSYLYKLAVSDTCGNMSQASDVHQTIHLTVSRNNTNGWNLNWNHYEGFAYSSYAIYRGTTTSNLTLLTTLAGHLNSYTDLTPPSGQVYYQVEAMHPAGCDPSRSSYASTRSNIWETTGTGIAKTEPAGRFKLYPNPTEGEFFVEGEFRHLAIYNMLGQVIFEKSTSRSEKSFNYSLPKGAYLVRITGEDEVAVKKLVIR